jgi:glycosyltransferase involved in cell wall biosynthesis
MRIGIDARELAGRPTGVGRYLSNLLRHWACQPAAREHAFLLYSPTDSSVSLDGAGREGLTLEPRPVGGGSGTWWEQIRLPLASRADRLDVLFAPAYTAPLAVRPPVVLTIHDVSFLANPEWFRPLERLRRGLLTQRAASKARVILTDSEFSKREIVERLGVSSRDIDVIPLGLSLPEGTADVAANSEPREPVVLFVGSIFNRRHVPTLIRAFARVAHDRTDVRLEVVGENRTYPYQDLGALVRAEGVADQVRLRSYVDEAALASLYRRASVFAFLSEYEGFGLTPLEALAAGVPVVIEDTAVARETCGAAADYVDRRDEEGVSTALRRLLFDPAERARVLAHAPEVLRRYSWETAAARTLAAIERAARMNQPGSP